MPIVLQPKERDALHAQLLAEFTLFVDLERAIHEGDEEACFKLGRKLSDGLRLLVDGGLGWQRRTVDPTVLTIPDSELRRIGRRIQVEAMAAYEAMRPDREESRAQWDEIASVRAACDSLLDQAHS